MANETMRIFFPLKIITYPQGEYGLDDSPTEIAPQSLWHMRMLSSPPSPKIRKEVIKNWMRSKGTIEFLGFWEQLHNEKFKEVEFDSFRR